jgi:hypothetical protein
MKYDRIVREFPHATNDWLRFQVGVIERRAEQLPVYSDGPKPVVIRHTHGLGTVQVFRLLGSGDTLERATYLAAKAVNSREQIADGIHL